MTALIARAQALSRHQGIRFLAVGGFAAAVNWIIRFPLSEVMPFSLAVVLAYAIGMSTGFTLYRRYVFTGSDRPVQQQTVIFIAVNLVGAVIVLGTTALLLRAQAGFVYPEVVKEGLAHGLAIGVGAVANFFGHRGLTFSVSHSAN